MKLNISQRIQGWKYFSQLRNFKHSTSCGSVLSSFFIQILSDLSNKKTVVKYPSVQKIFGYTGPDKP